jgi:hypothetical protein
MSWTEIINIKTYSILEVSKVVRTFYDLELVSPEKDLGDITLLRNYRVSNDFYIRLTWYGDMPQGGKSPLGYQLSEAFSRMGFVHHFSWVRETSLFCP